MANPRVPFPRDLNGERSTERQSLLIVYFVVVVALLCWLAESDYNPIGPMLRLTPRIIDPIFKFFI